jgi:hypothetical protein
VGMEGVFDWFEGRGERGTVVDDGGGVGCCSGRGIGFCGGRANELVGFDWPAGDSRICVDLNGSVAEPVEHFDTQACRRMDDTTDRRGRSEARD